MNIDITKLMINKASSIPINDKVIIPNEYFKYSLIDELKDVNLKGKITSNEDFFEFIGDIEGIMILKDDVTLEPVKYSFKTDLSFDIENKENKNIVDITDILWQNILVEVPSKVHSTDKEIELSGDGWRVISEDTFNKEREKNNNPFYQLDEKVLKKEE